MTSEYEARLNGDAIYAAMTWLRSYAESQEGQADYRNLMDEKADKISMFRNMANDAEVKLTLIPRFQFTDEFLESIYPGERESVECGIELARRLIWSPDVLQSLIRENLAHDDPTRDDALDSALRRFYAEGTH